MHNLNPVMRKLQQTQIDGYEITDLLVFLNVKVRNVKQKSEELFLLDKTKEIGQQNTMYNWDLDLWGITRDSGKEPEN